MGGCKPSGMFRTFALEPHSLLSPDSIGYSNQRTKNHMDALTQRYSFVNASLLDTQLRLPFLNRRPSGYTDKCANPCTHPNINSSTSTVQMDYPFRSSLLNPQLEVRAFLRDGKRDHIRLPATSLRLPPHCSTEGWNCILSPGRVLFLCRVRCVPQHFQISNWESKRHQAFFYDWIDRTAFKKGKPLPDKIGSLQCFLNGFTGAFARIFALVLSLSLSVDRRLRLLTEESISWACHRRNLR